jgi:hypothetical protein
MPAQQKVSAEAQLRAFIGKFDPKNQALIRAVRRAMRKRLPTATEMVYDNYNFFVIGYSPTDRPSEAVFSIAAYAKGVSLCFLQGARLADPDKLLRGSGSQTRAMPIASAADLDASGVKRLMAAALAQAKPMPTSGRGKLVIRSISKKQRPRRAAP